MFVCGYEGVSKKEKEKMIGNKVLDMPFDNESGHLLICDLVDNTQEVHKLFTKPGTRGFQLHKSFKAAPGHYAARLWQRSVPGWSLRNSRLEILKSDYDLDGDVKWQPFFTFGVDRGTCSVFCRSVLECGEELDEWLKLREAEGGMDFNMDDKTIGLVVDSGLGDGFYECFCVRNQHDEIVGVAVDFNLDHHPARKLMSGDDSGDDTE